MAVAACTVAADIDDRGVLTTGRGELKPREAGARGFENWPSLRAHATEGPTSPWPARNPLARLPHSANRYASMRPVWVAR